MLFLILACLLLAFVIFDVDHNPVVAKRGLASPLCIPPSHREELTLPYGLTAADVEESA